MATQPLETFGDLLRCAPEIEVRCYACGKRKREDPRTFLPRFRKCSPESPISAASDYLRCECGQKKARIIVPRVRR